MRKSAPILCLVAMPLACGGKAVIDGASSGGGSSPTTTTGTGGSSVGGSGAGGSGASQPSECDVSTSLPPPYLLELDFINTSGTPLFLRRSCQLEYAVTTCASDYLTPVELWAWCSVDCSDEPNTCIACEQCLPEAVNTLPWLQDAWNGVAYELSTNLAGCSCHEPYDAPAALYRVEVPIYASEQDAIDGNVLHLAGAVFELPSPDGVVEVMVHEPL